MKKIIEMLKELGMEYAYNHFSDGEKPRIPYICFYLDNSNNFSADGEAYFKISSVVLALYTSVKDKRAEDKVEAMLAKHGYFYVKNEFYMEDAEIYEIQYEFDIENEDLEG